MELDVIETWLYTVLSGDATLNSELGLAGRVYAALDPDAATYPICVFSSAAPEDIMVTGSVRILTKDVYRVEIIGKGSGFAAIAPLVDRVDALLHRQSGAAGSGGVCSCVREAPISRIEVRDGVRYYHRGGEYRILAK